MTLGWHCCVIGLSSWLCSYYALVRNLLETGYICLQDWWDCEVPWSMEWHLSKCRETDSALWVLRFLVSMFTCISPPITYISTLPHVSPSLSLSHFIIYIFFFWGGAMFLLTGTPQQLVLWLCCHCFIVGFSLWNNRENSWRRKVILTLQVTNSG